MHEADKIDKQMYRCIFIYSLMGIGLLSEAASTGWSLKELQFLSFIFPSLEVAMRAFSN